MGFLVLLKTFQRLGYFVFVSEVPTPIVRHIARCLGTDHRPERLLRYDESGTRRRHIPVIRAFLNVQPFNSEARAVVAAVVREAAQTKDDLADLMNVAIEVLVRNRFELPGFTTLLKEARRGRTEVNRVIQAATNKSEAFNGFVQWLSFGGERLIAENDRDRQRKLIKYNHLVANCLIFHNVQAQTRILRQLAEEGEEFDDATLSRLSPYLTEHVNRFGKYTLDLDRNSPALNYTLDLRPGMEPALATAFV